MSNALALLDYLPASESLRHNYPAPQEGKDLCPACFGSGHETEVRPGHEPLVYGDDCPVCNGYGLVDLGVIVQMARELPGYVEPEEVAF